jgi:ComF family protein
VVSASFAQCVSCSKRPLSLKQIRAAVLFDTIIPDTIHQLKYRNAFAVAEPLGMLMVDAWSKWQTDVDVVIPVPLHMQRQKKRGYNQSALLVEVFCRELSLTSNLQILFRTRKTPPQVGLSAKERRTNVKGAFTVQNPQFIKGGNILLVDDVCTTGATLMAAAEVLHAAGANTVSAYCLARAM